MARHFPTHNTLTAQEILADTAPWWWLTCDAELIQLMQRRLGAPLGHVVPQADGAERDEAEIDRLQEVPVALQRPETDSWDEDEESKGGQPQPCSMCQSHTSQWETPAPVDVPHRPIAHKGQQVLEEAAQEQQRHRDPQQGVQDTEYFAPV